MFTVICSLAQTVKPIAADILKKEKKIIASGRLEAFVLYI